MASFAARVHDFSRRKLGQWSSRHKWRDLARSGRIQLELGSGPKLGTGGWTTVDTQGADINHDLRRGIPLPDGSVDALYTSHLLEHLPFPALMVFLPECLRVLKPGGHLSVCVPNAALYIRAYMERRNFRDPGSYYQPARVDTGSSLDQLNYIAYMGGEHAYLFDEENLVNTLKTAGFASARLRGFDASIDLADRDFESIYAVATK